MRSAYYTKKNIDKKARKYIEELSWYRDLHPINLKRKKLALIVVDMQKYFQDAKSHAEIPSINPIIPNIKHLQDYFLENNLEVVQTRHINNKNNAKMMGKWWNDVITRSNPLSEICDELKNKRIKPLVKSQNSAFHDSTLESDLNEKDIKQIIITGVATHLCCETTARSAFMRGFEVFFTVDCVADWNEDFHKATLLNLSHGFAVPVLSSEIISALEK